MSKFSKYISEISLISDRVQEVLADKENKLKDKVQQNDLVRHRKVEEKFQSMEDELSSFRKRTDKLKAKRLKDIQDAETEINKSISDIKEQEKQAEISYNLDANGIEFRSHKVLFKILIYIFVLVTLPLAFMWCACFYGINREKNDKQSYWEEVLTDYKNRGFNTSGIQLDWGSDVQINTDVDKNGESVDNGKGGILINMQNASWASNDLTKHDNYEYYISVRFLFADGKRVMTSRDNYKLPDGACGVIKDLKKLHDLDVYIPYKVMGLVQDGVSNIYVLISLHKYDEKKKDKVETCVKHVGKLRIGKLGDKVSVNLNLDDIKEYWKKLSSQAVSANGPANCYIVSSPGLYKFRTVKGNSSTSVGSVAYAEVLWESFGTDVEPSVGDLVKSVGYSDGYITFQTADTFKDGNAVIAAKDAAGNILWSWHIWLTDQPQGLVYYNGAGTIMDRNLGATYGSPGCVDALGLLYQWGRKDPFLGSSSISSSTVAKSTISWPSPVSTSSSRGTVSYVTANPTTFVTASSFTYDWHYSSRDNTLWTTSNQTKSIYDPCPAGWRVPDGGDDGVWSKALGSSERFKDESLYSCSEGGMNFFGKFGSAGTIWYPASGYRDMYDGRLSYVGAGGYYWSASTYNRWAYYMDFDCYGRVNPSDYYHRADGRSVRCLQESK